VDLQHAGCVLMSPSGKRGARPASAAVAAELSPLSSDEGRGTTTALMRVGEGYWKMGGPVPLLNRAQLPCSAPLRSKPLPNCAQLPYPTQLPNRAQLLCSAPLPCSLSRPKKIIGLDL
jgi:hypothetical protein